MIINKNYKSGDPDSKDTSRFPEVLRDKPRGWIDQLSGSAPASPRSGRCGRLPIQYIRERSHLHSWPMQAESYLVFIWRFISHHIVKAGRVKVSIGYH